MHLDQPAVSMSSSVHYYCTAEGFVVVQLFVLKHSNLILRNYLLHELAHSKPKSGQNFKCQK